MPEMRTQNSSISQGDIVRIENAATKIDKPVHVVGSRAAGTAGPYSDWDYVIEGASRANIKSIQNSLPGAKSIIDNTPKNIDFLSPPLDLNKPHLTIYPRKQGIMGR